MADANLINSAALARVQDIDFVHQFVQGVTALLTVLDIAEPQVLRAGTQVQMYTVTGNLGAATINNVESAFGFTYLRNFLSLGTCVFDAKVPRGTVYATLTENINCYAVDLSELARAGLEFEVSDETGLIGVHHTGRHQNGTAETYADTGILLFPEVMNYIVKATISGATDDSSLSSLSIGSLSLSPAFSADVTEYAATTTNATNTVSATATDDSATVAIHVNGAQVASGGSATWVAGTNDVNVVVANGMSATAYHVAVTKS